MMVCGDDDSAGGEAAWPRIVAQRLVNCGDDDSAGGEAAEDSSTSSV